MKSLKWKKSLKNMDSNIDLLEWKISDIPSHDNDIHSLIKLMNSYGKLPMPFDLIAARARRKIYLKLENVDKIYFDYDFYMLYGNLMGESIWFTNTYILDYAPIYFGKNITVGPDVKLITSWHKTENFNVVKALPIRIGNNVWLTMNIVVLPGVEIGDNTIVGAGSVVSKSLPANVLAAGNPAKVIKGIGRDYEWWVELEENKKNKKDKSLVLIRYIKRIINQIRLLK